MKKGRILWVSLYVPYDKVGHAGGKTENYYIKKLQSRNLYDIFLISFYKMTERNLIDLDKYAIDSNLICADQWYKPFIDIESTLNPYNRYAGSLQNYYALHLKRALRKYKDQKGNPDIVILQWTQTVLLSHSIRELFDNVPIIAIEEDVQFLSYERFYENSKNGIRKKWNQLRYEKLKEIEIDRLKKCNKVCVNNYKDKYLLEENGIESNKIFQWNCWFDNYKNIKNRPQGKDILFYGAMGRAENYLSAIWFIENVFNNISDKGYRFIIIGSSPNKKLLKYASDSIIITGFIEDISIYFEKSLCLVAPLIFGAGVKVKIIEAMSAGIPVLTNKIGIEGISAKNGVQYCYCTTPNEYIESIENLSNTTDLQYQIGINAKLFIEENYDIEKSYQIFQETIDLLL